MAEISEWRCPVVHRRRYLRARRRLVHGPAAARHTDNLNLLLPHGAAVLQVSLAVVPERAVPVLLRLRRPDEVTVLGRDSAKPWTLLAYKAAAARVMRNDMVALWKDEGKRLPGFRYRLKELNQNAAKGGAIEAEDAITRYYSGQNRRPKFHGKNARKKFRADNGVGTVRIEGNRLMLPEKMGGTVRMLEPLRWPDKVIRECRISERGGRWYASVRMEISEGEYGKTHGEGRCGIDLGLSTFATVAWPDGSVEKVYAPEPHKQGLTALRRANRKLARRKQGGRTGGRPSWSSSGGIAGWHISVRTSCTSCRTG